MDEGGVDVSHIPLATRTGQATVISQASHVTHDLDPRPSVGSEDLLRSQLAGRFSPTESQSDTLLTGKGVVCGSSAVAAPSSASCYEGTHAEWGTADLAATVEGNNMNTNNRTVPTSSTGQIGGYGAVSAAPMPFNQSAGQLPGGAGGIMPSVQATSSIPATTTTAGTAPATGRVSPRQGWEKCLCPSLGNKLAAEESASSQPQIESWYGKPDEKAENAGGILAENSALRRSNEGLVTTVVSTVVSPVVSPVISPQAASQFPNFRTYSRPQPVPMNESTEMRALFVEKEVIESQMRKLRVENASLISENKQLKENYNKAQAKVVRLEAELQAASGRTSPRHLETSSETTQRCSQQIQQRQNEREVERLRNEVEMLRSQNAVSTKGSNLAEAYREEIKVLKVELESTRELLQRMERDLHNETLQQSKATSEVAHLKDVNRKLNAQIDGSISSVDSQKEINLLQAKLRVAVERLQEERTQRSEKLSQIEEQLINENATLKVAEKELARQLERARERHAAVVEKHRELYDELENLKVALTLTPDLRTAKLAEHKEVHTVPPPTLMEMLQSNYRDQIDDLKHESERLNSVLKLQIHTLILEKHEAEALQWHAEDALAASEAENRILRCTHHCAGTHTVDAKHQIVCGSYEEAISTDLAEALADLKSMTLKYDLVNSELSSVRTRLACKERSLESALGEVRELRLSGVTESKSTEVMHENVRQLCGQVKGLQSQVQMWRDKADDLSNERNQLDHTVDTLQNQVEHAKLTEEIASENSRMVERRALQLEVKVRDEELYKAHVSCRETEGNVRHVQQLLQEQTTHSEHLREQVQKLQNQVHHHCHESDRMANVQLEFQAEIKALQESLTCSNNELTAMTAEHNMCGAQIEQAKMKINQLQADVADRERKLGMNIVNALRDATIKSAAYPAARATSGGCGGGSSDAVPPWDSSVLEAAEVEMRQMAYTLDTVQADLVRNQNQLTGVLSENTKLEEDKRLLTQAMHRERTVVSQLISDRDDIQRTLRRCQAELESSKRTQQQIELNMSKLEKQSAERLELLEEEANKVAFELDTRYHLLDNEGKKLAVELGSVKRLLESRERENELLRDTIKQHKTECDSLNHMITILTSENASIKDKADVMQNENSVKLQENAVLSENNQNLLTRKMTLESEALQLQSELKQNCMELERNAQEIANLKIKAEKANERQRELEKQVNEGNTRTVAQETELRHVNKTLSQMEQERSELRSAAARLRDELRNVASLNGSLEQQLKAEHSALAEEKAARCRLNETHSQLNFKMDILKKEYDILTVNFNTEQQNVQKLKDKLHQGEQKLYVAEHKITSQEKELEAANVRLKGCHDNIDKLKDEKSTLYSDVQELCTKLSDKDEANSAVQRQHAVALESIHKERETERAQFAQTKLVTEEALNKAKKDIVSMATQLQRREEQLKKFVKTAAALEKEQKRRQELETRVAELTSDLNELRVNKVDMTAEIGRLKRQQQETQDSLEKIHKSRATMKDHLREQRDKFAKEAREMQAQYMNSSREWDAKCFDLQKRLDKALSDYTNLELSLNATVETKNSLQTDKCALELHNQTLKQNLNDETSARKMAEQKLQSLSCVVEEMRAAKAGYVEQQDELNQSLSTATSALIRKQEAFQSLQEELSTAQTSSESQTTQLVMLKQQLASTESELRTTRDNAEETRTSLVSQNERLSLELTQLNDNLKAEREKLNRESQRLAAELESTREQLTARCHENQRLREGEIAMRSRLNDANAARIRAVESLDVQECQKQQLSARITELEIINANLRKKEENEARNLDLARDEVRQMLENVKKTSDDTSTNESMKLLEEKISSKYKSKMLALKSAFRQEQTMHAVTQSQLKTVEAENKQLLQQVYEARKKLVCSNSEEGLRPKNRTEEINQLNQLIARSQTRAHQMLTSSNFGEAAAKAACDISQLLKPVDFPRLLHTSSSIGEVPSGTLPEPVPTS